MHHTPATEFCLTCLLALAGLLAAIVASFWWLDLPFGELLQPAALQDLARFFASFFPPNVSPAHLTKVWAGSLETLAISALGTLLAVLASAGFALAVAGWLGPWARRISRLVLNILRSVPELVWATLMVLAAGLGPFAGTLALALHTSGVLGRLIGEALENAPAAPRLALLAQGCGPTQSFLYGTWPLIAPQVLAYTLYRWEINIRMATTLGFVGAGGLGQLLYYELSLFHQAEACTVILAMLILTWLVDGLSGLLRRRMGA